MLPRPDRRFASAIIFAVALLAFEAFNFDSTRFALGEIVGDRTFLMVQWATILALAFGTIDFAGLIHLFFTPQEKEMWYLMGAWLLGATLNAILTWYAVGVIVAANPSLGGSFVDRAMMIQFAPPFLAAFIWLTRILFIGSISLFVQRNFTQQPARGATESSTAQKRLTKQPQQSALLRTPQRERVQA